MYDTLEGLDYKPGECAYYVSKILKDVQKSFDNGDLEYISSKNVRKGDVVVSDVSSHLMVTDDYRGTISPKNIRRECNGGEGVLETVVLVIKNDTLQRKRKENVS